MSATKLADRSLCIFHHTHAFKGGIYSIHNFFTRKSNVFRAKRHVVLNYCRHCLIVGVLENDAHFFAYVKSGDFLSVTVFEVASVHFFGVDAVNYNLS